MLYVLTEKEIIEEIRKKDERNNPEDDKSPEFYVKKFWVCSISWKYFRFNKKVVI